MAAFQDASVRAVCGGGVSIRGRYQGHGIGLVDDKGRVAIPNALRTTLQQNAPRADGKDGGTIVIGPHESNECLVAYDPAYVEIRAVQLDAHEAEHTAADGSYDYNYQRRVMAGEAVPFDGSGRFIMPAFPRFHANIGQYAFFQGINNRIEIWDPATALADPSLDKVTKKMIRFYMAEKGVEL
jgi:MraZ protein